MGIPAPDITPVLLIVEMVEAIDDHMDEADPAAVLATVLASIVITTAVTALLFFILGRFFAGRFVQFVPAVIIHGFFGAIAYKASAATRASLC